MITRRISTADLPNHCVEREAAKSAALLKRNVMVIFREIQTLNLQFISNRQDNIWVTGLQDIKQSRCLKGITSIGGHIW